MNELLIIMQRLSLSSTTIRTLLRAAEHAEGNADIIHYDAVTRKETNDEIYRLELFEASH